MKNLNILVSAILVVLFAAPQMLAQDRVTAKLLPDRSYRITIKKTLAGNDGFTDIIPVSSMQLVTIETGSLSPEGMPADITVYRAQSASDGGDGAMDWQFSFVVKNETEISDVVVKNAEGDFPEALSLPLLSKRLAEILLITDYRLNENAALAVNVISEKDLGSGRKELSFEIEPGNQAEGSEGYTMMVSTHGTAVYDAGQQFFTEIVTYEENRIHIAEDIMGDEKQVLMKKDLRYKTVITAK